MADNKVSIDDLWLRYRREAREEDRDELILHYLPLVKGVVGRLSSTYPAHIKIEDLYSSGITGLMKAIEKYEPGRANKFETYANLVIRGAVIDELRDLDWVPRSVHQKAQWMEAAQHHLQRELGRDPTNWELAKYLQVSEEELDMLYEQVRPAVLLSLHSPLREEDGDRILVVEDRIPDERALSSFVQADHNEFCRLLEEAIASLSDQEQKVLTLYYYQEYMLKEIGVVLGVSESRVSQIHTKALIKLRSRFSHRCPL